MKKVPEIGDIIPAFDDGKIRFSRIYVAKITDVIPYDKATKMDVDTIIFSEDALETRKLSDVWKYNKALYSWVFADDTDYIIEAQMEGEVANPNYFARMKNGGWFSLNVQSFLQGAKLDTDFELYNYMITEGYGSPYWGGDAYKEEIEKYNKIFGLQ